MIRSTAFWSPATVILGGTLFAAGYFDSQDQTRIWFLIAAASWLVAMGSRGVGWIIMRMASSDVAGMETLTGFVGGMLLRVVGTVALFLITSYYFVVNETWLASWVLGWHVALLSDDVIRFARARPT